MGRDYHFIALSHSDLCAQAFIFFILVVFIEVVILVEIIFDIFDVVLLVIRVETLVVTGGGD